MYILTRDHVVIDYCAAGYLCMGSTVVCEDKQAMYEDATIVDIGDTELPSDILDIPYRYVLGDFIKVPVSLYYTKEESQRKHVSTTCSLTVAGWASNVQTISVQGVSTENTVLVSPTPSDTTKYSDANIICTEQGVNSLTFTCDTVPDSPVTVNLVILEV